MLAFIINRKNLILDNVNPHSMQLGIKKEIMELEVKKKIMKIKAFDPGEYIELTGDNSSELTKSLGTERTLTKREDRDNSKTVITNITHYRQHNLVEKVSTYKKLSSSLDIISAFLIIVGAIISVIENDTYYKDNMETRVISAVLINGLRSGRTNFTALELIGTRDLNDLLSKNLSSNLSIIEKNNIILGEYNLSEQFNFQQNPTPKYFDILVPLTISRECSNLRLILLVTSLISGMLIYYIQLVGLSFISKYLGYLKEYIYIKENDSNL